ncbi:ptzC [Candidatus Endolissoclinum faulkneri L2]|uniref:PtzC n=1 Tax=Candidatus Endolissoclinum faulkneri L2 TaxID=1193729 RepID=K7YJ43_9PROT|nr:SDR family NAD(P)-dependent oxidoreductase [Candidatus Endolissoclinum faulkneri]AFX99665.1 ptzC [Candidatus Endolissoclinum faulkneri L2]
MISYRDRRIELDKAKYTDADGFIHLKQDVDEVDLKSVLLGIVSKVLGEKIDAEKAVRSFADLGLGSLLSVRLIEEINRAYGLKLGVETVFAHPNPSALVNHVASMIDKHAMPTIISSQKESSFNNRGAVAIIGISGAFGSTSSLSAFSDALMHCESLVHPLSNQRRRLVRPLLGNDNSTFVGGFLKDIELFDAELFGLSPREASAIDPQQRLFLERAYLALENAGYPAARIAGKKVGVYVGASPSGYEQLIESDDGAGDAWGMTGNLTALLASRISYYLDLGGPALTVDTACSSSLVALDLAIQGIKNGDCDMALVGGVSLFLNPISLTLMKRAGMQSKQGRCATFDASADGIVVGEAVVAAVLKPFEQSLIDGDRIDAVVLSTAINQDGRSNGITAPNSTAQTNLICAALDRAGLDADAIDVIEAHGTGTPLGDPVEIAGLFGAFRKRSKGLPAICLGSAKSVLGHASEAAGLVGVANIVAALKAESIPPIFGFTDLNPRIDLSGKPLKVTSAKKVWPRIAGHTRRAGVNSFGLAGTNAHAIIAEGPSVVSESSLSGSFPLLLSAENLDLLAKRAKSLLGWLKGKNISLIDFVGTLALRRSHYSVRAGAIVTSLDEVCGVLAELDQYKLPSICTDPVVLDYLKRGENWIDSCNNLFGNKIICLDLPDQPLAHESLWAFALDATESTRLSLSIEDPKVGDHRVGNQSILHAAALLDIVLDQFGNKINEIAWLRPVIVGKEGAVLILNGGGKSSGLATVEGGENVFSFGASGSPDTINKRVEFSELLAIQAAAVNKIDGGVSEPAPGVWLGPTYRGFDRLSIAPNAAVGSVDLSNSSFPRLRALDAAIQSAVALVASRDGDATCTRMPVRMHELSVLMPIPPLTMHLLAYFNNELSCGVESVVDVSVVGDDGTIAMQLNGLTLHAIDSANQTPVVQQKDPSVCLRQLVWQEYCTSALGGIDLRPTLIIGNGDLLDRVSDCLICSGNVVTRKQALASLAVTEWLADTEGVRRIVLYLPADYSSNTLDRGACCIRSIACSLTTLEAPLDFLILAPGAKDDPVRRALIALAKVSLDKEIDKVTVRTIDCDNDTAIELLLTEPGTSSGEMVVLTNGKRFEQRLKEIIVDRKADNFGRRIVILGGFGRVGRVLANRIAECWKANIVLVGRKEISKERAAYMETLRAKGVQVYGLSIDLTDSLAAEIALCTARDKLGGIDLVIQAVVDPVFGRLSAMPESDMLSGLRAKTTGGMAVKSALEAIGEGRLVVVSSIGAFAGFPGAAGQAVYAAQCAFESVLADATTQVVHWGLWADPSWRPELLAQVRKDGLFPMPEDAAFDAFESALSLQCDTPLVAASLSASVWRALGDVDHLDPALGEPVNFIDQVSNLANTLLGDSLERHVAVESIANRRLLCVMKKNGLLGLPGKEENLTQAIIRFGAPSRLNKLAHAILNLLIAAGAAERCSNGYIRWCETIFDDKDGLEEFAACDEISKAVAFLMADCIDALPKILSGELRGTDVLFPEGSVAKVEPIYKHQPGLKAANVLVAEIVASLYNRSNSLSVLEIGAGTGATTEAIRLRLGNAVEGLSYCYTDVSVGFVRHGEKFHSTPSLTSALLDIEQDPIEQGFIEQSFDVVVASNVLHATTKLDDTLIHVWKLLRPGGILILNENVRLETFATLTFGLLEGWWRSEDPQKRLADGPLLDLARWRLVLSQAGLDVIAELAPGNVPNHASQVVIVSLKAGVESAGFVAPVSSKPIVSASSVDSVTSFKESGLQDTVRQVVAEALGRAADSIDDSLPFADYGVDSIVSPQIAQSLAERFQVTLRSTDLFSYATVDVLSKHIKSLGPIIPDTKPGDIVQSTDTPTFSTPLPSLVSNSPKFDRRIAIIGLAGRFPDAPDVSVFWHNLRDGHCAIRPIKRFFIPETFDVGCDTPTPIYARWAGLIDDFDQFDPLFFKITPSEALTMDPQQRLLLEEAWHAIEDAGLSPDRIVGGRTGVFVGSSANSYVAPGTPAMQTIGGSMAILSARLAYLLDLRGPTFPIDTGCSSSLVALSLARDSLLADQCDLAIVAGVGCNLLSEDILAYLSDAGMASPNGVCYAFDDRANGFVPGEGVGVLILKRLADAENDNDRIRALILGAGINQDGRTSGITAPSASSQTALVRRVWKEANVSAESITLVEAHGTGTRLGDPIEVAALNDAFAAETSKRHFCAIGSVKTNIGHAMAAAGLAGLIKTVLALENRAIPGSLFFEKANRHIDFDSSPLVVARKTMPWSIDGIIGGRRRAGVSSFGFSGTNAHVVLEEAPEMVINDDNIPGPWIFVISAKTNEALNKIALALASHIEQTNDRLGDIAYTLALRREHFRCRRVVIAAKRDELTKALRLVTDKVYSNEIPNFSTSIPKILRDAEIDYLAGNIVDFTLCFPGNSWRLVSLPGYPFARERYWQPIRREAVQASSVVDPQLIVDGNTVTIILAATNWRLDQHRVHGRPMLPAAAMVELIGLAIMAKNESLPHCLADLVWHRPVNVEGNNLLLTLVMNGDEFRMNRGDVLVVEGRVDSFTYQSQVIDTTDFTGTKIDGSYLLSISKARGIAYGERFAILSQIYVGEGMALARLSPNVQATCRTADIIDAAMQAAAGVGLGGEKDNSGSPSGLYVPHALGRIVWLTDEKSSPVHVLATVLRRDVSGALFDITIANENGQVLAKMDKLVARRMEGNNNELCLTTLHAPRWISADERGSPMLDRIVKVSHNWLDSLGDLAAGTRLGVIVKLPAIEYGKLALAKLSLIVRGLSALPSAPIVHLMAILDGDSEAPFVRAVAAALRAVLVENVGWRLALVSGRVNDTQLPTFPSVAYVEDLRITSDDRLERRILHDLGSITTKSSSPLSSDSVVVISGGLGGLGCELASVLSRAGLKPVLLSRRSGQAEVPVVVADVTDKDALEGALATIRNDFGPITAVLHLAGKQLDGIFSTVTSTDIDEVFAAKVTGFITLDDATRSDPIKLFAVFGSTAAEFGSFGQGVYGAANAAVASLAANRPGPGNTLCVAWPLWKSGGMTVPDDLVNMLKREAGLEPLSTELGVNALWNAAHSGEVTPLVLHGIGDVAAGLMRLSTSITPMALPEMQDATPPIDAIGYIASILSEVAAIPLNRIDPELPFEQYGIDSMMITRLNLAMERDLGALPKTLFFEYRTPGEIANYLSHNKASELATIFKPTRLPISSQTTTLPQTSKFNSDTSTIPYLVDREDTEVAIIGIAGIFPGAEDLEVFWEHLRSNTDLIREIPIDRWPLEGFYDPDRENISTSYSKWGGFIEGAEMFDPLFFDMAPVEAEALDPQARKMLEVSWWALEDAGYTRSNLFSSDPNPSLRKGGVFVGLMHSDYQLFAAESRVRGELAITSSGYWNAANRISHFLNLHGPSVAIDTACSASLTAIYSALRALAAGDCTVAIAGGVNLSLHPMKYWVLSKAGFASTDGRCRSFGEGGNGYVPGEGAGAVVLKPLSRAKADGDRIHGVIRASAVNHGGRTSGFTVPNPVAQGQLISDAFKRAGIAPSSVSYVEAHGTGTALGDPIEINGLKRSFGNVVDCPIGSVKSNIGHLESAAGIAALTKVLLQMRHRTLAPSLHANTLNPDLGIEGSGFRVVTKAEPWKPPSDGAPLRAGISSFGAGGSNAHLIVDAPPFLNRKIIKHEALPFPLSARTSNLLKVVAGQLAKFVENSDASLADISFTLVEGREAMKQRAVVVAADRVTLIAGLWLIAEGKDINDFGFFDSQCSAWIKGESVDWRTVLPEGAGRIGLPLTPFERRRCWISTRHDPAFNGLDTIHEVCQVDDPLIVDHVVEGKTIAAGALLISEAVRKLGLKFPFTLSDVSWRHTVTVSSEGLLVNPQREDNHVSILVGSHDDVVASFTISNVVVVPNRETIPVTRRTIKSSEFYSMLATAGVVYGSSFARIKNLSTNAGVAVGDLSQPTDASRGLLDSRILDAALQACAGIIEKDGSGLRPASIGKLNVWRALSDAVQVVVRRRGAGDPLMADISLFDGSGETVATLDRLVLLPTASVANYGPPLRLLRPTKVQITALPARLRAGSVIIVDPYFLRGLADALVSKLKADDNVVYLTDVLTEKMPDNLTEIVYLGGVGGKGTDGVLALMRLCKTLAANRITKDRLLLRVVVEDTPSGAAVTAFAKALSREMEWLQLCLICLPVASQPKQAAEWINVTPDAPQDAEISVHDGIYSRLVLNEIQSTAAESSIVANGRYLIAGGSGGIGRALGRHLAETQGATVWLIGRRPLTVDEQASIADLTYGKISYIQADITDIASMSVALSDIRSGGALDGIIHAALVMEDKLVVDQTEFEVERILAPKTRGIDALMATFDGIKVNSWIAFSSSNAYTANQGQAAYAAASAYLDASVLATGKNARVIDWGLWGDIGRMAGDPRTAGLKRMGVWPIATAEGFAAFKSILAGRDRRVLAMKLVDTLLPALGVEARSSVTPLVEAMEEMTQNEPPVAAFDSSPLQAVDAYAIASLAEYLDGVPSMMPIPEMQRLANAIDILRMEATGSAEEMKRRVEAAGKGTTPYVVLLDHALPHLREVVEGSITAASILFPDGSDRLVAPIYKGNPLIDWLQRLAARAVAAAVQDKLIRDPSRPIRVVEIGAGTAGTTGFVLEEIAPFINQGVSYTFTDIGPSFLVAARRQFADIPNFEVKLLDVSRSVADQGFDNASVDVVLAANVVHATPCIAETLSNIAQLLTHDGVLVLKEATGIHAINTLTFGLTAEWWGYSDPQSRMSGGPLLSRAGWRLALTEVGYRNISIAGLPGDIDGLGAESVIVSVASNVARVAIKALPQEEKVVRSSNLSQVKAGEVHSSIENKLIASVAEALHLDPNEIDLSASFADYGADSIISVELVRKINESFGIELKTTALFNFATVRDLARYITLEFGDQSVLQQAVLNDKDELVVRVDETRSRTNRLREIIDRRRTAAPVNAEADFLAREAQNVVDTNQEKLSAMSMENLLKSLEVGEIDLKKAYEIEISKDV